MTERGIDQKGLWEIQDYKKDQRCERQKYREESESQCS